MSRQMSWKSIPMIFSIMESSDTLFNRAYRGATVFVCLNFGYWKNKLYTLQFAWKL
jgi:hypothetical protein